MPDSAERHPADFDTRAVLVNRLPELAEQAQFRRSLAVVVGIDAYGPGIPPLRTAVNDAARLAELLAARHGYETILLTGQETGEPVSGERLRGLFGAELPARLGQDDRLLFYFAGHGVALDGDDGPEGYLVPQDAEPDEPASMLPMTDLHAWLTALPCRHMLAILDCCFAGAFRWASTRHIGTLPEVIHQERFERYLCSPAWQVLTSAAYDQKALDVLGGNVLGRREAEGRHSPFAQALIAALEKGEADLVPRGQGDGVITATELYLYLREQVEVQAEAQASHQQTPGLWPLKKHRKGEFIFLAPGHVLNLPPAPELTGEANPYRGLKSYDHRHTGLFFGREEEIRELVALVDRQPFVAVLGASGTGKSSLVKAGLLPRLQQARSDDFIRLCPPETTAVAPTSVSYRVLSPMRPTDRPVQALATLLHKEFGEDPTDLRDSQGLAQVVARWAPAHPGQRLVLTIDQFEELATLCRDDGERARFLRLLAAAVQQQPDTLRLIVTLRTDFEPQFTQQGAPLAELWPASRYVVPPMDIEDLRQIIEGPASVRVLYFEPPELVDDLIKEVIQTPGALPLLSFTLSELYVKYVGGGRDDRALSGADYQALGGVIGSLRNRASEEYDALPDDAHKTTMQRVMLRMVAVEGGELARRRVALSELEYPTKEENARVQTVLKRLVDARLLVCGTGEKPDGTKGEAYVEPAHDALVLAWDKLLRWKKEAEEYLLLQRRLAQAASEWSKATPEDQPGLLWDDDPRLPQLEEMVRPAAGRFGWARRVLAPERGVPSDTKWLNNAELAFVQKSIEARARLWRRVVGAAALLALVLISATVVSLWLRDRAVKAEATAVTEATRALNAESTAVAEATRALNAEATAKVNEQIAREKQAEAERSALESRSLALTAAGREAFSAGDNDTAIALAVQAASIDRPPEASLQALARFAYYAPGTRHVYAGHLGPVTGVALTPDGQRLLSGSTDKIAILWDVATGTILDRLEGHNGAITSVAVSPDGLLGLTGSEDGTAMLWSLASGAEVGHLTGHQAAVNSVAFSPDGQQILTGSSDGTMVLWDTETQEQLEVFGKQNSNGDPDPILAVAFHPNRRRPMIAAATTEGPICLWDLVSQGPPVCLHEWWYPALSVAFSPAGDHLLGGLGTTALANWDISTAQKGKWWELKGHAGSGRSVAFRPDGLVAASGSNDNSIIIWNPSETASAAGTQILMRLNGHTANVNSVIFTPDGRQLFSGSDDGTIRLWDLTAGAQRWQAGPPDGPAIWDAACRSHPKVVAVGPGGVHVWTEIVDDRREANSVPIIKAQTIADSRANMMALSPDGAKALTGYFGEALQLWDLKSMRASTPYSPTNWQWVTSIAFSPDGNKAVSTYYSNAGGSLAPDDKLDRLMVLWDVSTGMPIRGFVGHRLSVWDAAFSPDGRTLMSASADDSLIVWDVASGQPIRSLLGHSDDVRTVAFSPLGDVALSGSDDGSLILWDTSTWEPIRRLTGHTARVKAVAVSPDGRHAISGSTDQSVILWDLPTGAMAGRFVGHSGEVTQVAFCPDGTILSVAGGVARLWDPDSPEDLLGWVRANRYVPQPTGEQ